MKSLLTLIVAVMAFAPAAFAGESKTCDQAKASTCSKAKASECANAKKVCPKALRQALTTHKGATFAKN